MKPGTYVSRSVYAKLQAENKRLMRDIKVMACGVPLDAIQMRIKYREQFRRNERLNEAIKKAAQQYAEEHPEFKQFIDSLKHKDRSNQN